MRPPRRRCGHAHADPRGGRPGRAGAGRRSARGHGAAPLRLRRRRSPGPLDGWDVVVNAAAWTDVDGAETHRADAWRANATGPAALARAAQSTGSSSCTSRASTCSTGRPRPVSGRTTRVARCRVYGASKAAGDLAVQTRRGARYLLRTDVGGGRRVATSCARCSALAARGVAPTVVDDQIGRLTFAADLAAAVMTSCVGAPFGRLPRHRRRRPRVVGRRRAGGLPARGRATSG